MREEWYDMQQDIKEIKTAILGSKLNPNGMISRLDKVESIQDAANKRNWMITGGAVVLTFLFNLWGRL